MTDKKTIKTRLGVFTVRRPTEAEAIAQMQKRIDKLARRFSVDALDDGDEEVISWVLSPAREAVEEALNEAPKLAEALENAAAELAGHDIEVQPGDPILVTDELRQKHGKRLLAVTYDGKPYVLSKIGRVEYKLFERRQDHVKALAELGRGHTVLGTLDPATYPYQAIKLGQHLLKLAKGAVDVETGK